MGQSQTGRISKPAPRGPRCPICTAPSDAELRPFCSTRCADVDLSRWLRGAYAIPSAGQDGDEDGDDTHAAQPQSGNSGETSDDSG